MTHFIMQIDVYIILGPCKRAKRYQMTAKGLFFKSVAELLNKN